MQKQLSFPVGGMSCAACAAGVENTLRETPGVAEARVNFADHTAWVVFDEVLAPPQLLQARVADAGYELVLAPPDEQDEAQERLEADAYRQAKSRALGAGLLALPVFVLGMFFMHLHWTHWASMALTLPVLAVFGRHFFIGAYRQAKHGRANMDTLVALSTGVAFLFSAFNLLYPSYWTSRGMPAHVYFEAAAVIVAFVSLGKWLEAKATRRTAGALKALMALQPPTARLALPDGGFREVPAGQVQAGQRLEVRAGERIPVDAEVLEGQAFVDESMISGEPIPKAVGPGAAVYAGTVCQSGLLLLRANQVGGQTVLAQIVARVKAAQSSKAPVQRLADRVSAVFVPAVLALAVATVAVWLLAGGWGHVHHAVQAGISVLVIACPCALGLATPTAMMVGMGRAAGLQLLIRDAESLELACKTTDIVFDKTGTLTEGRPSVVGQQWRAGADAAYLGRVLGSLEAKSEHPLAQAVAVAFAGHGAPLPVSDYETLPGRGLAATVEGRRYWVGNARLIAERQQDIPPELARQAEAWQREARTVVFLSDEDGAWGVLAIADALKASSRQAVGQLRQAGVAVHLLTGDNRETALAVARQLGIDSVRAEALPADKEAFVQALRGQGRVVAMVGDGINDAPALAAADVSMAMAQGTDLAMGVAQLTLMTSDLLAVPKALALSRLVVGGIRQNLFWAFLYNVLGIPLAAGVLYPINGFLLDPMVAGAAMAFSSVSVVLNSLRLRTAKL